MSNQAIDELANKLMHLISVDDDNEVEINQILSDCMHITYIKETINKPMGDLCETMLMWAVWRFKILVVEKLLQLGANPRYINPSMESVSTYWREDKIIANEQMAINIARLLHNNGANLAMPSHWSYDIVKRSLKINSIQLSEALKDMGYTHTHK
jgi:ferric iron reductase protein FhuF